MREISPIPSTAAGRKAASAFRRMEYMTVPNYFILTGILNSYLHLILYTLSDVLLG